MNEASVGLAPAIRSAPAASLAPATVLVLSVAFAVAGPVMALAPLGMAPLLVAAAVFAVVAERVAGGAWPALPPRVTGLSVLFLAWCALSLIWALNGPSGARKLADMVLIFGAALVLAGLVARLDPRQRRRLAAILAGGTVAGLLLLAEETAFHFPLYRLVMGASNPKLSGLLLSKRSVDAFPLLVWPAALAFERLGRPLVGVALALLFTLASFRLTAASSTFAMLVSLMVLAVAWRRPVAARHLMAAGTLVAFALIIPGAILAYDQAGHGAALFGSFDKQHRISGGQRLEIWHFAAEKSLDRPILGHGIHSSRFVPNDGAVSAFQPPDKPVMTLHPHDGFLQIWVELGLVGVVLAAALLLTMLRALRTWPPAATRFALAGYAAAVVVAGLAFGLWQTWWMATLAFGAVACAALTAPARHA